MESAKLAGTLSLCKRAGKLTLGFDMVKESLHKKNAQLILFAEDLSPKTEQDIRFLAGRMKVPCQKLPVTMDELWYLLGKRVGVAAVTDAGLARKLTGPIG